MWVKQMYVGVYSDAGWMVHSVLCVLGCRLGNALCANGHAVHCCFAT